MEKRMTPEEETSSHTIFRDFRRKFWLGHFLWLLLKGRQDLALTLALGILAIRRHWDLAVGTAKDGQSVIDMIIGEPERVEGILEAIAQWEGEEA